MTYPRIRVEGGPRERGRQYGEAARAQVARSIEAYTGVFQRYAGWGWDRVREEASAFRAPIEAYEPKYLEEMRGLAEGAGVEEVDVLAINVRTEVMFAAKAREAEATGRRPAECSSFALLPSRSADGATLLGQNWDWLSTAAETVVVVEAEQDAGPNFVTVVEAGLLAKFGFNSAGVGLVANALVTDLDRGRPAVPFHVLLRAIFDSETISDALAALQRAERASSANFLVAHEDGLALDVEASAGGFSDLWLGYADDGLILHTNHCVNPGFSGRDVSLFVMPDSPFRWQRLHQLVDETGGGKLDRAFFERLLSDHAGYPYSICYHPDPRLEEHDHEETVAAAILDLGARKLWLASGTPCTAPFEELDYTELLRKPSAVRAAATA